ncbi:guanylate cyclase [Haematococcus lacustris]
MARYHPEVTIMFADLVSFTSMCSVLGAPVVMSFLNTLFCAFDDLCDKHGVYKVETVGDGFVVAGGLMGVDQDGFRSVNQHTDPLHACKVFALARDMLRVAAATPLPHTGAPVGLRVGLHCGPCTSGVIGRKMPRFCLFGDTMNVASRMETTCSVGSIHLSQAAYTCLQQQQRTHIHALRCQPELQAVALALELEQGSLQEGWEPTGGLEVKGKGLMQTWRWRPPSPAAQ